MRALRQQFRPGDRVRIAQRSVWREAFGDVVGVVDDVEGHTRRAWVTFPELSRQAQGFGWEEFELVERFRE